MSSDATFPLIKLAKKLKADPEGRLQKIIEKVSIN